MVKPRAADRTYTEDQLEVFAEWRWQRQLAAPRKCNHSDPCWVELGPPAMRGKSVCQGCNGMPTLIKAKHS
jgi:hypothetical protein